MRSARESSTIPVGDGTDSMFILAMTDRLVVSWSSETAGAVFWVPKPVYAP